MNFIITIFVSLLLTVIAFFTDNYFFPVPGISPIFGAGCFLTVVTVVSIVTAMFQTMILRQHFFNSLDKITTNKRKININTQHLNEYIEKLAESMIKLYPEYEKDIFKSISPSDAEGLQMYLVKYPELKFSGVLETHIVKINELTAKIYNEKHYLESVYQEIRELYLSEWFLFKPSIPEQLKAEIFN